MLAALPLLRRFWPALVIVPLLAALWWRGVQIDRLTDKLAASQAEALACSASVSRLEAVGKAKQEAAARTIAETADARRALADAAAKLRANVGKDRGQGCEVPNVSRQVWETF